VNRRADNNNNAPRIECLRLMINKNAPKSFVGGPTVSSRRRRHSSGRARLESRTHQRRHPQPRILPPLATDFEGLRSPREDCRNALLLANVLLERFQYRIRARHSTGNISITVHSEGHAQGPPFHRTYDGFSFHRLLVALGRILICC